MSLKGPLREAHSAGCEGARGTQRGARPNLPASSGGRTAPRLISQPGSSSIPSSTSACGTTSPSQTFVSRCFFKKLADALRLVGMVATVQAGTVSLPAPGAGRGTRRRNTHFVGSGSVRARWLGRPWAWVLAWLGRPWAWVLAWPGRPWAWVLAWPGRPWAWAWSAPPPRPASAHARRQRA